MGEFDENNIKNKYMELKIDEIKTLSNIGDLEPEDLSELGAKPDDAKSDDAKSDDAKSDANSEGEEDSKGKAEELNRSSSNKIIRVEEGGEEKGSQEEGEEKGSQEEGGQEAEKINDSGSNFGAEPPPEISELDKLNTFYELKYRYENNKYERCAKEILSNKIMSWKLKRKKFAVCKPKCINCNRRVGSIFSIKYVSSENVGYKSFVGKCGDLETPCPFNIEFNLTNTVRVDDLYIKLITDLNRLQAEVIVVKNKAVFGIIRPEEAVEKFNELQKNIAEQSVLMEQNMTKFFNVIQNGDKQEEIKRKINEFNEHVASLKLLILSNEEEPDAVKNANVELNQLAVMLSNLKYVHREVIDDEYNIIFSRQTASKFYTHMTSEFLVSEFEVSPEMKIINFNIGNVVNEPRKPDIPIKKNKSKIKNNAKVQTKKNVKEQQQQPKNKTVRRADTRDITDSLNDLFQTICIEDRVSTITVGQAYKILEEQYKITNVREKYGSIVKNYLNTHVPEWEETVSKDIVDVAYKMVQEDIPRNKIYEELKNNYREKHRLSSSSESGGELINYGNYNRVIDEMFNRYEILLESVSPDDPKPKPDWPKLVVSSTE
jgi:hypothetical protein